MKLIRLVVNEVVSLGYITEAGFFIQEFPRVPVFYILLKVHKDGRPLLGRPIVSACDSPLDPLAKYLEHFLHPFVPKIGAYIKDTGDFIKKVEGISLTENAVLVTADVSSL